VHQTGEEEEGKRRGPEVTGKRGAAAAAAAAPAVARCIAE